MSESSTTQDALHSSSNIHLGQSATIGAVDPCSHNISANTGAVSDHATMEETMQTLQRYLQQLIVVIQLLAPQLQNMMHMVGRAQNVGVRAQDPYSAAAPDIFDVDKVLDSIFCSDSDEESAVVDNEVGHPTGTAKTQGDVVELLNNPETSYTRCREFKGKCRFCKQRGHRARECKIKHDRNIVQFQSSAHPSACSDYPSAHLGAGLRTGLECANTDVHTLYGSSADIGADHPTVCTCY